MATRCYRARLHAHLCFGVAAFALGLTWLADDALFIMLGLELVLTQLAHERAIKANEFINDLVPI